jgi:hypothetical protein
MKLGTFSWRNLVGSLLIVFGGLLCALVCLSVTLSSFFARLILFQPLHPGPWWMVAASHLLTFAAGALWWQAGRWIRDKTNGWWPLLYLAVGYACGVGGAMLQEQAKQSAVTPVESVVPVGQD